MDSVEKLFALAEQGDVEAQYKLAFYMDPMSLGFITAFKRMALKL